MTSSTPGNHENNRGPAENACHPVFGLKAPARNPDTLEPVVTPSKPRLLGILGPGLIIGASNDDPGGVNGR
jgi:hypothetical protein